MATTSVPNTPAVSRERFISRDELAEITSYDEFVAKVGAENLVESSELGDGFELVDKDELIKTPMLIVDWQFSMGDHGEFVSVRAITRENRKIVFNDGSTGVKQQIIQHEDRNGFAPLICRDGLRVSEYEKEIDGKMQRAKTYYIA